MNRIIYGLAFLFLVVQIKGQLNQEESKKIFYKCLNKELPKHECNAIFEVVFGKANTITEKVKQYKRFVAEIASNYSLCLVSNRLELDCDNERAEREKEMIKTKRELYPWLDVYEICESDGADRYCDNMISFFLWPDNWHKKPEQLIGEMKALVAITSMIDKEMKDGKEQTKSSIRGEEL